jgi:hypothetical protein
MITALLATLVDTQLCPPNWDYWGSNCYFFDTDAALEAPTYWHGAVSRCSDIAALYGYNATLPSIHSEDENTFIFGTIVNRYGYPDATRYDAWIGLIGGNSINVLNILHVYAKLSKNATDEKNLTSTN